MATSVLMKEQKKHFGPRRITTGYDFDATIQTTARYDDECRNGHNSFSLTADIRTAQQDVAGGCLHEEIANSFPELKPLIKWHLCGSDGPMHYIANTVYQAGERDCHGKLKGEPMRWETSIQFGKNPIKHQLKPRFIKFLESAKPHPGAETYDFEVLRIDHEPTDYKYSPKFTFGGYDCKWYECPFDTEQEALDFLTALQTCEPQFVTIPTAWGEGKARDLDAARVSAIWPEATDEELTALGLEDRLKARLPKLLEDFQAAVESLGFVY